MSNEKFSQLSSGKDGSYWLYLGSKVSKARFIFHVFIYHFFILFSSCALLNMDCNTPYGVFQINICSDTLSLAIFPSTQAILLNFLWHCPFYCNWMICMRWEGGSVSLSFLSLKWKELYSSRTLVFWILFYYLDVSELMWAMAWEFPGARLQVFFPFTTCVCQVPKGFITAWSEISGAPFTWWLMVFWIL